jgi:uncharacterized protein YydD (DUF2326 family)
MIERVWSDLATFKEARFDAGFNVVLADTAEDSKETESTNGLGKTTLIRIIHFCLGSDLARDKALNHPDLAGVMFGLDLQLGEAFVTVSRNTATPKEIAVSISLIEALPIERKTIDDEMVAISLDDE